MKYIHKTAFPILVAVFFASVVATSAKAQSDAQLAVRMTQMEEQMRTLLGQVEQLTYQVQQLQTQIAGARNSGSLETQPLKKKKQQASADQAPAIQEQGVEEIVADPQFSDDAVIVGEDGQPIRKAPGPKLLGTLPGSNMEGGQVLVAPGGSTNEQALASSNGDGQVLVPSNDANNGLVPDSVETVSLGPTTGDDPEVSYERSYENLLRRQFGDAEAGFRGFLEKHRDHSLAGNAQYWLGETYYVQGEYKQAAQAFLTGYRDFPKSRKAADSLLKLGLSLDRLGQKQQACAAYSQLDDQFPKATEARKRAQTELKRAGC
jgi:tol-pal system protein YbgF